MTSKSAALEATLAPGRTLSDVYARQPLRFHDKIPIFSKADRYIENYERIAHDHLTALQGLIPNTFNPDYFVHQMEYTTAMLLRKYVRPDSVVLDVGVGRGT